MTFSIFTGNFHCYRKDGNIHHFIYNGLFAPKPVAWNILYVHSTDTLCTPKHHIDEAGKVAPEVFTCTYTITVDE